MKKYIIPTLNFIITMTLLIFLNFRDGTLFEFESILFAFMTLLFYVFIIDLIRKGGNNIKVSTMNKVLSLLTIVLITGAAYETISGNMISDYTGDLIAFVFGIIALLLWLWNYYIKPYFRYRGKSNEKRA